MRSLILIPPMKRKIWSHKFRQFFPILKIVSVSRIKHPVGGIQRSYDPPIGLDQYCTSRSASFASTLPRHYCAITAIKMINPNSLAPFFVSSLSPRKGRGQKMGVPPGFRTGDPPHHNALFTHGTPPGCRCPGSDFVPI